MIPGQISPLKKQYDDDSVLDLTASDTGEPLTVLYIDQGINCFTNFSLIHFSYKS